MLLTLADSNSTCYWCHPHHVRSSPNAWQQCFGGVYLDRHSTNIAQLRAWVVDYVLGVDGFAMLPEALTLLDSGRIAVNVTSAGVMTLRAISHAPKKNIGEYFGTPINWNTSYLSNDVWGQLLHLIAYKIQPRAYDCKDYVGTTKTFGMQVTDRFGRVSNTIFSSMLITTAGLIFDNSLYGQTVLVDNDVTGDLRLESLSSIGRIGAGLNVSWGANTN